MLCMLYRTGLPPKRAWGDFTPLAKQPVVDAVETKQISHEFRICKGSKRKSPKTFKIFEFISRKMLWLTGAVGTGGGGGGRERE